MIGRLRLPGSCRMGSQERFPPPAGSEVGPPAFPSKAQGQVVQTEGVDIIRFLHRPHDHAQTDMGGGVVVPARLQAAHGVEVDAVVPDAVCG